jgi:hypothetical protein
LPSVSKKQFGMMGVLYKEHKISRKQLEDFNKGVHPGKLPTRVKNGKPVGKKK